MPILSDYWQRFQAALFPFLENSLQEPLTEKQEQFIRVLDIVQIERFIASPFEQRMGRKRKDRRAIARSFIAKAVYDLPTTQLLVEMLVSQPILRKLCGFERRCDVPSAATFSRAFEQFASLHLGDTAHEALVRMHVGDRVVMHVSRDSTEVPARERPYKTRKPTPEPARKRGRPRADVPRQLREPNRMARQYDDTEQTLAEALADLPTVCDIGAKSDSKGNMHYWTGWKAHIDWADGGIPLNVVTTSASLHDSQVAIPMARSTARRVISLYDLMDSAYDSELIRTACEELGHVPIIDVNPRRTMDRRKATRPMDDARARRYLERNTAERGNSRLKDEFGFRHLRVRGHPKTHMHLMFGVLALYADQLYKVFGT